MRYLKLVLFTALLILSVGNQSCKTKKTDTAEQKHTPEYAFRVTRGGPDTIVIDKSISLDDLIIKLNKPWRWAETGADYWIGYTDDMFQIAYHKQAAIEPLINLIKSSDSLKTKTAALFTLHLIGINSTVVGRGVENFCDTLARKAILSFLDDNKLNRDIAFLLKRDPWPMDIPYLDYLAKPGKDYTYVLSALRKYLLDLNIENRPLFEDLPEEIYNKELTIKTDEPDYNHPIADLIALKNALGDRIEIDQEILNSNKWIEGVKSFNKATKEDLIQFFSLENGTGKKLKPRILDINSFGSDPGIYFSGWDDSRFYYSYHNNKLFIYSQNKARMILLEWWTFLPLEEKSQLLQKKSLFNSLI
jgi:hypothetical protein